MLLFSPLRTRTQTYFLAHADEVLRNILTNILYNGDIRTLFVLNAVHSLNYALFVVPSSLSVF